MIANIDNTVFFLRAKIPGANPEMVLSAAWSEKHAHWILQQIIASMWDERTYEMRNDRRVKISKDEFQSKEDPAEAMKIYFGKAYKPLGAKTRNGLQFKIDEVQLPEKDEVEYHWFEEVEHNGVVLTTKEHVTIECHPDYDTTWTAICGRLSAAGYGNTKEEAMKALAEDIHMQYEFITGNEGPEAEHDEGRERTARIYKEVFGEEA